MPRVDSPLLEEIECHLKSLALCVQNLAQEAFQCGNGNNVEILGQKVKISHRCGKCQQTQDTFWEISFFENLFLRAGRKGLCIQEQQSDLISDQGLMRSSGRRSYRQTQGWSTESECKTDSTESPMTSRAPGPNFLSPLTGRSTPSKLQGSSTSSQRQYSDSTHPLSAVKVPELVQCSVSAHHLARIEPRIRETAGIENEQESMVKAGASEEMKLETDHGMRTQWRPVLTSFSSQALDSPSADKDQLLKNTGVYKSQESPSNVSLMLKCGRSNSYSHGTEDFEQLDTLHDQFYSEECMTAVTPQKSHVKRECRTAAVSPKKTCRDASITSSPYPPKLKKKYSSKKSLKQNFQEFFRSSSAVTTTSSISEKEKEYFFGNSRFRKSSVLRKLKHAKLQRLEEQLNALNRYSEDEEWSWSLFHHDSRLVYFWEILLSVTVLYTALITPLKIGFHSSWPSECGDFLDISTDVIFMLNLFVQSNTSFKDPRTNETVFDRKVIWAQYIRGPFLTDLVCAFPVYIMIISFQFSHAVTLMTLFRLVNIKAAWKSAFLIFEQKNPVFLRMGKIVVLFVLATHFVSCGYWFILEMGKYACDGQRPWVPPQQICEGPILHRYAKALSMSLALLSGSSMGPLKPCEFWFECGCFLLGFIINATIIASASTIVSDIDLQAVERKHQVDSITQYMRSRGVPSSLQTRVQRYFHYLWDVGLSSFSQKIVDQLPPNLELELNLSLKKDLVEKCPLFTMCSKQGVIAIIQNLTPLVVQPKDVIVRVGEYAHSMFFINKGCVSVYIQGSSSSQDGVFLVKLGQGAIFGEVALITEDCRRTATVTADTFVELQELKAEDFQVLLGCFPELQETVKFLVENRLKLTEQIALKKKTAARFGLMYSSDSKGKSPSSMHRRSFMESTRKSFMKVGNSNYFIRKCSNYGSNYATPAVHKKAFMSNSLYNEVVNTKDTISYAMARDFKAGQGILKRSVVDHEVGIT